jgi:putative transcriptional regulator
VEEKYFDPLISSLEDAAAFAQGDTTRARMVEVEIPEPVCKYQVYRYKAEDVVRTRKALNLTQSALAFAIGVSPRTVEAWESGRNEPSGTASRLLYLLDRDHSLLSHLTAR